ncbi:MAG TPA: CCA tRNA nucleotidyltransferase [Tepidisphaeraceae bacterium]|jgi:tRNA nucleotidyltransferase/poly(A) polymerase
MTAPDAELNAATLVRTLRDNGHVAYFAGGCVRDRLLGLSPKDYDVATDAPPDRVRELFKKTQAVGAAFGVILVRLGGSVIEVATFRSDGVYADGRRPESVTFATAEQDAQRRDFTINGLFFDPIESKLIDYVGGQTDLAAKVLRAIGDPAARFNEDHLRLLRAVRFAGRFDLTIEPATAAAIDRAVPLLPRISAERIADELRRILTARARDAGYRLLWQHRLLHVLLPTLAGDGHAPLDASRSLLLNLAPGEPVAFPVAWLATVIDVRWQGGGCKHDLLGNLVPADVAKLVHLTRTTLRLSNDELEAMADIARLVHGVLDGAAPDDARLKRFLARESAGPARQLLDALSAVGVAVERIAHLRPRLDALAGTEVAPPPLLTGDDLIRSGIRPGPAFKRVLDAVYDAQLNGTLADTAAALAMGRKLAETALPDRAQTQQRR